MKIWTVGDLHFGQYPLEPKWLRMMTRYFDDFFIPLLKEKVEPGDVFVQLGDIFHDRGIIDIKVMNTVDRIFEEIGNIIPTHIIVGNHDIYNKASNDINSPKILRKHDNIHIYEETTEVQLGPFKCVMMPWVEHKKDQIELLKKHAPADFLFCHSDLNGCKMHLNSVAHKNNDKIDVQEFKAYNKVVSGHIHILQRNTNFLFAGSAYQLDRNDIGNQKGIHIFGDDGEYEFIPNTISPEFRKLRILNEEDIEKLDTVNTNNDYIDLSVSNSLLVNNRKMRRKLEQILETSSFSSIDYINDLVVEEAEEDDDVTEIELAHFDDFKDVRNRISSL
jgi:calcineurin-like phosphoesterase family protein